MDVNDLAGMDRRIARRWIKALRSGKYKQGKQALKKTTGGVVRHCCLGVLCEEIARVEWEGLGTLPPTVARSAKLPNGDPQITVRGTTTSLARVNDAGVPFGTIANMIEKRVFGDQRI